MAEGNGIIGAVAALGRGNVVVNAGLKIHDTIKAVGRMNSKSGDTGSVVSTIFDTAIGQCATEGQIALVMEIGQDGFEEAFMFGLDNGRDASGTLTDQTDHPEAIGDILTEAEAAMTDVYRQGHW